MIRSFAGTMVVAAAGMLALGCTDSNRTLVDVTGTVTYNGAPVADAMVTFSPTKGVTAFGMTDAQGKYSLATPEGEGAEPGMYIVTVRKSAPGATSTLPTGGLEQGEMLEPGQDAAMTEAPTPEDGPPPAPESLIPAVYATPQETPLREVEVKTDGLVYDIVLDDNAQPAGKLELGSGASPTTERP